MKLILLCSTSTNKKRKKRLVQLETLHKKTRFFDKDCFSKCDSNSQFPEEFLQVFLDGETFNATEEMFNEKLKRY